MIKDPQKYVANEMLAGGEICQITYLFDGDNPNQVAQFFGQELTKEQINRIAAILNEENHQ